jgi:hypothetical protein
MSSKSLSLKSEGKRPTNNDIVLYINVYFNTKKMDKINKKRNKKVYVKKKEKEELKINK